MSRSAGNVDAYFGRRLPRLLRQAGFSNVRAGAHAQMAPPGDYRRDLLPALVRNFNPLIVQAGVISKGELDEQHVALIEHLANPETLDVSAFHIQAWGRMPKIKLALPSADSQANLRG